jgi:ribosomal protein S18 acetylase RimI-like enzyme
MYEPRLRFESRRARASDADAIAEAHLDSIRSIGPRFYAADVVDAWGRGLTGELYRKAMEGGEVFFIAIGTVDGVDTVLGFASDYRIEGTRHGTSVYVRGCAARCGVGTALLRLAEAHAAAAGARSIHIDASLAGAGFYRTMGYEELGRGNVRLMSGYPIGCVHMRKMVGIP